MDGAEIVVTFLKKAGITTGFGVGGGYVDPLLYRIARAKLDFHVASRESGAAFAADGYARTTRKPAFVVATAGPGETNTLTAVANAKADSVPLFILTGHVATGNMGKNAFQDGSLLNTNLSEVFSHVAKSSFFVPALSCLLDLLRRSLVTMMTGRRGPVHLTIPYDVLVASMEVADEEFDLSFATDIGLACDTRHLRTLLQRLDEGTEDILLIAGDGILQAGAAELFGRFVTARRLSFVVTPKAKSLGCYGGTTFLGSIGLGGTAAPGSFGAYRTALILGSSLSELSYLGFLDTLKEFPTIFQVDVDPQEMPKVIHGVKGIIGDLVLVLDRLCTGLPERVERGIVPAAPFPPHVKGEGFHPGALLATLSALLPASTLYFADSGSSIPFSVHYLELKRPASFHVALSFAPMGWAIGAAIGGAVALKASARESEPVGPVVCITGENAFLMEGLETVQAIRQRLPILFVILNNGIYNMPYHRQLELYGTSFYSSFPRLELAPALAALGMKTVKLTGLDSLDAELLAELGSGKGPCLLEAFVDPGVKIPSTGATNIGNVKDLKAVHDASQLS